MKYVAWFFGFIGISLAVIFAVILLRNALRQNDARSNPATLPGSSEVIKLTDYKKPGVTVRMVIQGPVVADEDYREIQVDITIGSRSAKVLQTYKRSILKQSNLGNNQEAFSALIDALSFAGFTTVRPGSDKVKYAGQCPTGQVYYFDLIEDGQTKSSLWRSTCTNVAPGTLGTRATPLSNLIRLQVPDIDQLVSGENISF